MSDRPSTSISSRKQPKQARSSDLVAAILEAAVRVLTEEGAQRFTTARVAEKAGVSVGSLYQYFPNKAAILFALQSAEWRETKALLRAILEDGSRPPLERLRNLVHAFVRSECEEAAMRGALEDAAPLYRDVPEARAAKAESTQTLQRFMREVLPQAAENERALAGDLVKTVLGTVGKHISETRHAAAEIDAAADALADMLCAYLTSLHPRTPRRAPSAAPPPAQPRRERRPARGA